MLGAWAHVITGLGMHGSVLVIVFIDAVSGCETSDQALKCKMIGKYCLR